MNRICITHSGRPLEDVHHPVPLKAGDLHHGDLAPDQPRHHRLPGDQPHEPGPVPQAVPELTTETVTIPPTHRTFNINKVLSRLDIKLVLHLDHEVSPYHLGLRNI